MFPIHRMKDDRYSPRVSHSLDEGRPEILSLFISIWGYLWGVCHTPLPRRMKGFGRIDRQSHFSNEGQPEILSSFIFIWGYLWGVCHTLLSCRMKGGQRFNWQFSSPNEGVSEIRLAIPFSKRNDVGGSIGNPILSAITY